MYRRRRAIQRSQNFTAALIEVVEKRALLSAGGLFFNYDPAFAIAPEPYTFRLDPSSGTTQIDWQLFRVENGNETLVLNIPNGGLEQTLDPGPGEYIARITTFFSDNSTTNSEGTITIAGGAAPQITAPLSRDFTTPPTLEWTAVGGASHYVVDIFDTSNNVALPSLDNISATSVTLSNVNFAPGTEYRVSVTAAFATAPSTPATSIVLEDIRNNFRAPVTITGGVGNQSTQTPALQWFIPAATVTQQTAARAEAESHEVYINAEGSRSTPVYRRVLADDPTQDNLQIHSLQESLLPGNYEVWVRTAFTDGTRTRWGSPAALTVSVAAATQAPVLTLPNHDSANQRPEFSWTSQASDISYSLQVASLSNPNQPVISISSYQQTSFVPTVDLTPDLYAATVRASRSGDVTSDWSDQYIFAVHPRGADPVVITGGVGQQTTLSPTITWEASYNLQDGYELFIGEVGAGSTAVYRRTGLTGTSHQLETPLEDGKTYNVWVRADYDIRYIPAGSSRWGDPYALMIGQTGGVNLTDPLTITGGVGQQTDTTPVIEWQARENVARYEIWINRIGTRSTAVQHVNNLQTNSYELTTPLDDNTAYEVWVRAHYQDDTQTKWGAPAILTLGTVQTGFSEDPLTFTSGTGDVTDATPTLEWSTRDGLVRYDLYVNEVGNRSTAVYRRTNLSTNAHTIQTALSENTQYEVWIRGFYSDGTQTRWGSPAALDVGIVVSNFDQELPQMSFAGDTISWEAVPEAVHYRLVVDQLIPTNEGITREPTVDLLVSGTSFMLNTAGTYEATIVGFNEQSVMTRTAVLQFTVASLPVAVPVITEATDTVIRWQEINGATGYELWVNQLDSQQQLIQARVLYEANLTGSEFSHTLASGSYRVWLRAIGTANLKSRWSQAFSFDVT